MMSIYDYMKHSPSFNSKVVLPLSELRGKLLNDDSRLRELSDRLAKNKIIQLSQALLAQSH
jgi:hypothetical protein